jgi:hypothetical protein
MTTQNTRNKKETLKSVAKEMQVQVKTRYAHSISQVFSWFIFEDCEMS